jgi:hypothetical protein
MSEEMVRIKHLDSPNITAFIGGKQIDIRNHEALVTREDAKAIVSGPYGYELIGVYDNFIDYVEKIHIQERDIRQMGAPLTCVLVGTSLASSKMYAWQQYTEALLNLNGREKLHLLFTIDELNQEWTKLVYDWSEKNIDMFYNISIIEWDSDKEKAWNRVFKITVGRQLIFNFARRHSDISHVWFIDSDNIVPKHALESLTRVNREATAGLYNFKSVVAGGPVVFNTYGDLTWPPTCMGEQQIKIKKDTGLTECDWTGAGCLMLSRRIFEKYNFEWSRWVQRNGEDAWICLCAQKETGERLKVDTSVFCGHLDDRGEIW